MRRGDRLSNVAAGVIALVLVVAFTYGGFTKFRWPFGAHYEVQAVFRSAATELQQGSPVRMAGVEIGRVRAVERGPGGTAVVTLRIEAEGRPLRTDATMKIRPRLFLEGNFFVDVQPGTSRAPELPDGGTVPLSQTANAVQVDEVLRTLERPVRQDLQDTVKGLAAALDGGGGTAIRRAAPEAAPAFKATAVTAEAARGERPGDLARFVAAQAAVSAALAADDRQLADLVTNFAGTVSALAAERDDLRGSLRALDRTVATAGPALVELGRALPPLRSFTAALRPALRTAPGVLDVTTPFVRAGAELLRPSELPALADALRPAARDLRAITPQLDALLGAATPVARCVSRNVVPVLNGTLEDGIHTTGKPVWQELAQFPVGLAAAGETFDANGHTIRYGAGGGENLVTTRLPGIGELYAMTDQPLLGARPKTTPGQVPPFDATAPCTTQDVPDLRAETAAAPSQRKLAGLDASAARRAIRAATDRLRRLGRDRDALRSALRKAADR